MFLASLLVLMTLLLPPALSGHQVDSDHFDGNQGISLEPSLAQTVQNFFLARLGLQSYPNPHPGAVVPQYLLDLYHFHTQQYHLVEDPDFSFPVEHVQGANTVRTFHHAGKICVWIWLEFLSPWGPVLIDSIRTFSVYFTTCLHFLISHMWQVLKDVKVNSNMHYRNFRWSGY